MSLAVGDKNRYKKRWPTMQFVMNAGPQVVVGTSGLFKFAGIPSRGKWLNTRRMRESPPGNNRSAPAEGPQDRRPKRQRSQGIKAGDRKPYAAEPGPFGLRPPPTRLLQLKGAHSRSPRPSSPQTTRRAPGGAT
eukprot:8969870-Pyramimonas_sp.AAC.1